MMKLKVFIGWSGEQSKIVAKRLADWLEGLFDPDVACWVSDRDMAAGVLWHADLLHNLEGAGAAVFVVTETNKENLWIIFEAGFLLGIKCPCVCPYLYGIDPDDLPSPFQVFQAKRASRDETLQLVETINHALDSRKKNRLEEAFETHWSALDVSLRDVPKDAPLPLRPEERMVRAFAEKLERVFEFVEAVTQELRPDVRQKILGTALDAVKKQALSSDGLAET